MMDWNKTVPFLIKLHIKLQSKMLRVLTHEVVNQILQAILS